MSDGWKQKERLVAGWFGSVRNPLSGRNNVSDDGTRRLGDLVYPHAVVEVKRRKANTAITRAKETRQLAAGKPWIHVEFSTGQPEITALVMDYELAKKVCKFLDQEWALAGRCFHCSAEAGRGHFAGCTGAQA